MDLSAINYSATLKIPALDGVYHYNITEVVKNIVKKSGISSGLVFVQSLHTTCAIAIQEDEAGIIKDILENFDRKYPKNDFYYHHKSRKEQDERRNGAAHLKALEVGHGAIIVLNDCELQLGVWQSILLFDFDPNGRKERSIVIQIIGIS